MEIIKKTYGLENFKPWQGAKERFEKYKALDKLEELEMIFEDLYPEGIDETDLNDIFWFEEDWLDEMLGISEDEEDEE